MKKIHYTKPSITELEVKYATDAAVNGWGEKCYDYIYRFEALFREHIGVKYAIATSSCTGALHMGLSAIGVGPGDEVILADINWIASAAPITYLGAKPVFVDILPDTWCIDPSKIEAAITSKTKAIIAVHLYGNLCEMDEIIAVAKKHDLVVVEDAAEAIGSIYKGKRAGSIGDFGVFSFHGTKTITTGEGGMFVTNREDLYDVVQTLNNHGRNSKNPKQFWCERIGFKYKISNIQAAIGCAQMERVNKLIKKKREIFSNYKKAFSGIKGISMNPEKDGTTNGFWMPTIVFDKSLNLDRENLLEKFKENNIDGRVFFYPLSSLQMFKGKKENTVSHDIFYRAINLPSYHDITDDDIKKVSAIIEKMLLPSRESTINSENQFEIIRQYKNSMHGDASSAIPILKKERCIGFLKPVTPEMLDDKIIIDSLVRWRQKYMNFFLTQFTATADRTRTWLKNVVLNNDTRILFLIYDESNKLIGNYGVCNISSVNVELDNMIRGEIGGDRKLMFYTELALIKWITTSLGVWEIYLHAFSNNYKTLAHHESVGFLQTGIYKLNKEEKNGEIRYSIDYKNKPGGDEFGYVKMVLNNERFHEICDEYL